MGILFKAATGLPPEMRRPTIKTYTGSRHDLQRGQQYKVRCVTAGILVFAKDASKFHGLFPYSEEDWK